MTMCRECDEVIPRVKVTGPRFWSARHRLAERITVAGVRIVNRLPRRLRRVAAILTVRLALAALGRPRVEPARPRPAGTYRGVPVYDGVPFDLGTPARSPSGHGIDSAGYSGIDSESLPARSTAPARPRDPDPSPPGTAGSDPNPFGRESGDL